MILQVKGEQVTISTDGPHVTPEYRVWVSMRHRCRNPNNNGYHKYGARGIQVCERWNDFSNFIADMGMRPSNEHSIDRIDTTGHYEPSNCRWATILEQNRNKRTTLFITFKGITKPVTEWAVQYGISDGALRNRVFVRGWPVEKSLTTPIDRSHLRRS